MRRLLLFAAALSLASCATLPPGPMDANTGEPSRAEAIEAVAGTAAAVADAIGVAPPASVVPVVISAADVRRAFERFDAALNVVDGFVATGAIKRGTPTALAIRRGLVVTRAALNTASAAQRAGTATSYAAALRDAQAALASVQSALAR